MRKNVAYINISQLYIIGYAVYAFMYLSVDCMISQILSLVRRRPTLLRIKILRTSRILRRMTSSDPGSLPTNLNIKYYYLFI